MPWPTELLPLGGGDSFQPTNGWLIDGRFGLRREAQGAPGPPGPPSPPSLPPGVGARPVPPLKEDSASAFGHRL
jgi:hypothetical protein